MGRSCLASQTGYVWQGTVSKVQIPVTMIRPDLIRGIYRLQQSVGLTPMEFRAAGLFAILLFLGLFGRRWMDKPTAIDPSTYAGIEASFRARAADIAHSDTITVSDRPSVEIEGDPVSTPVAETDRVANSFQPDDLLDLNTATADDLIALPRIGPALAGRILAFRSQNGPFRFVDDLLMVRGIGEKTLEGLRPLVHIGRVPDTAGEDSDTLRAPTPQG